MQQRKHESSGARLAPMERGGGRQPAAPGAAQGLLAPLACSIDFCCSFVPRTIMTVAVMMAPVARPAGCGVWGGGRGLLSWRLQQGSFQATGAPVTHVRCRIFRRFGPLPHSGSGRWEWACVETPCLPAPTCGLWRMTDPPNRP